MKLMGSSHTREFLTQRLALIQMFMIKANVIVLLCSLSTSILSVENTFAAGRYDEETSTLTIDCVEILSGGNTTGPGGSRIAYNLSLLVSGEQLSVLDAQETSISEDCSAVFETTNNTLTSETRVVDDIYDVRLQFDVETARFTMLSADYNRRGETSLWRVSNGERELFLGGTIHILRDSDFPLPLSFLEAYQQADTVVFETNPDEFFAQSNYNAAFLPTGQSLVNLMQSSTVLLVNTFLIAQGSYLLRYDTVKPEFLARDLVYFAAGGAGYGDGVDGFFVSAARADEKHRSGLELVVAQVEARDNSFDHDHSDVNELMTGTLNFINSDDFTTSINGAIVDWREGNIARFAAENIASKLEDPVRYDALLTSRNRSWIPILEQHLASDEVELVLAGVGHFAGPDNVIQLLEEAGYTVERYFP